MGTGAARSLTQSAVLAAGLLLILPWPGHGQVETPEGDVGAFMASVRAGDVAAVRGLVTAQPTLVAARDAQFGATALHFAAAKGNRAMVQLLLEAGASLEAKNAAGETPARVAERVGRVDVLPLLLTPGAAVIAAAKSDDLTRLAALLAQHPQAVSEPDSEFGGTALHWAAYNGSPAVASILLARGADRAVKNRNGESPLEVALRRNRDPGARRAGFEAVIAMLRDPEPEIFDAVRTGDVARVARLLDADPALVGTTDQEYGATPLHFAAAASGKKEVVSLLLDRGASTSARNRRGETPAGVAERSGRADLLTLLGGPGAAVIAAAKTDDVTRLASLLAQNPKLVNEPDLEFGGTALHWAAYRGSVPVASILVAQGADRALKNRDGETALQIARRRRDGAETDQQHKLDEDHAEDRQEVPQQDLAARRRGGQQALQAARLAFGHQHLGRGQQPGDAELQHHPRRGTLLRHGAGADTFHLFQPRRW